MLTHLDNRLQQRPGCCLGLAASVLADISEAAPGWRELRIVLTTQLLLLITPHLLQRILHSRLNEGWGALEVGPAPCGCNSLRLFLLLEGLLLADGCVHGGQQVRVALCWDAAAVDAGGAAGVRGRVKTARATVVVITRAAHAQGSGSASNSTCVSHHLTW